MIPASSGAASNPERGTSGGAERDQTTPAQPALTLDCRAMRCPLPIIELARHIGDVAVGDVVVVIADDPAAAADVPAWCRLTGHEYLGADDGSRPAAPAYRVRRLH